jgi:hypothetical protein
VGSIINADINASAAIVDTKLATIATAGKVSNSATTATNANTGSAIVARDGSGNFSAGTITSDLITTLVKFNDGDASNWVALASPTTVASNITWTLPNADGSNGNALVTNGSGTLSWASPGAASVASDTATNTDFLLYFAATTTGSLSAVKQDSGLTYNPSTGLLTTAAFSGDGSALTGLPAGYTITNFDSDFGSKTTTNLTEGDNLYYTNARVYSSLSIVDAGGDGSLGWVEGTGTLTYTGPSAAEVRAHITASTGISITDGAVSNTGVLSVDGVTGSVTAANLMTAIQTVDGTTSGLDADLLDGNHATAFATSAQGTLATNALPKSGGAMTGPITTNSTFDGVDIATRDGVLTTTTTTANAALPKAGGTMTGLLIGQIATTTTIAAANDAGSFSVRGDATYPAVMSFHRAGAYAVNFGLSTANKMELGGWSASTIKHTWDMATGTYTSVGNVTAPAFVGNLTGTADDADLLDGQAASYYRINVYNSAGTLLN